MDWKQKANYLAKRADEKGGIWLIWLNEKPQDEPTKLGSTTDPEDLRDPKHLELGWYGPGTTREQVLADVAAALGSEPEGVGPAPEPTHEPHGAGADPEPWNPNPPAEEAEEERPIPDPANEPVADNPPIPPRQGAPAPASQLPGDREPGDTATAIARDQQKVHGDHDPTESENQEATVADDEPSKGLDIPESVEHSIRAKLYNEYTKAHEKGPRGSRDAWKRLIDLFEDEVAG